ncbi:MAG: (Fe-S)-binding protein [Deltaproteobacteria bacterium]|nr:(Fe-S)-binding protein [Candidatus Anaeroferrophillacea bacterium]
MLTTALDYILVLAAVIVMLAGFARRPARVRQVVEESRRPADFGYFLSYILGHGRIVGGRPLAGIAHLAVFWGVGLPLVVIAFAQFPLVLPAGIAGLLSLVMDVLGLVVLAAGVYFLIRRLTSAPDLGAPRRVVVPLLLLLVIVLSGFVVEGARLRLTAAGYAWQSPVGWCCSSVLPASPLLMQAALRFHFFAVLLFVVLLPFTFMRHLLAASLNVLYRDRGHRGALTPAAGVVTENALLAGDRLFDAGQLLELDACVACGRCAENCPAALAGKVLNPRRVVQNLARCLEAAPVPAGGNIDASRLADAVSAEEMWACTGCMACVEHCPVLVRPLVKVIGLRRHEVQMHGRMPAEAVPMIRNLEIYGDVDGRGCAHRGDWAHGLDVPHLSERDVDAEMLLWVGCQGAFHPRYREVLRELVKILRAGGVRFGILGTEERCCGDAARRLGDENLFLSLARENMDVFNKYGVRRIVAVCPHGYNTLKNEYRELGADFEVWHAVECIADLIRNRRVTLRYPLEKSLAIHDPCYLGRVNGIYEPLRTVVRAVPGVRLTELPRNRERALCCGGGAGRMWLHEKPGQSINQLRAREIRECGVEAVGAACPFCLTMLEDGIGSLELESPPRVLDIVEIVAASMAD